MSIIKHIKKERYTIDKQFKKQNRISLKLNNRTSVNFPDFINIWMQ